MMNVVAFCKRSPTPVKRAALVGLFALVVTAIVVGVVCGTRTRPVVARSPAPRHPPPAPAPPAAVSQVNIPPVAIPAAVLLGAGVVLRSLFTRRLAIRASYPAITGAWGKAALAATIIGAGAWRYAARENNQDPYSLVSKYVARLSARPGAPVIRQFPPPGVPSRPTGIANLGASTCYANSAIQLLSAIDPVVVEVMTMDVTRLKKPLQTFVLEMRAVLSHVVDSSAPAYAGSAMFRFFQSIGRAVDAGDVAIGFRDDFMPVHRMMFQQQSAPDFLFNVLQNVLVGAGIGPVWNDALSFRVRSRVTGDAGIVVRDERLDEPEVAPVQVDLSGECQTLHACLVESRATMLNDGTNVWRLLDTSPAYLLFSLSRFAVDEVGNEFRNGKRVDVPELLDMATFMGPDAAPDDTRYRLVAAVLHYGDDHVSFGHYVALKRLPRDDDGRWWLISDDVVYPQTALHATTIDTDAVLLLYRRSRDVAC
ncbi:unnamed protein product (mitochondrion) [Plasmodiophora brassicae]|uniref:USP domain-containing protein n=1 Tax=Plasmodiophora brassicae TaxID=37360 RepID=A0A0G4IYA2_PLABS|nr:hypothetical protein PBRA_008057 [Plasmodiophora brassicae]SPQ95101.1 unnamed protein product [Plasmodiophora brassicae]